MSEMNDELHHQTSGCERQIPRPFGQLALSARVHEGLALPLGSTAPALVKSTCLITVLAKLIGWMFTRS